ncbi:MAG TPA: DUF5362 family protein [Polyangiaceae bacterium]|jgi:hypothetical protein
MNPYSPPGLSADIYPGAPPAYAAPPNGAVSEAAVELLRQTRPWVVLLSIVAFIGSAAMVLIAIFMAGVAAFGPGAKGSMALLGLLYLPLGLLYIYPGVKLWSYGAAISRLAASRSVADLEDALAQQKSFWKFSGVASIVLFVVYAIAIIAAIAVGVATGLGAAKTH